MEHLNIKWIDDEETEVRVKEKSNDNGVKEMFGSENVLSQRVVNNLIRKYNIPNFIRI